MNDLESMKAAGLIVSLLFNRERSARRNVSDETMSDESGAWLFFLHFFALSLRHGALAVKINST